MPRAKSSPLITAADLPEVAFRAGFSGPAVDAGRMNAKALAPSLFATASMIEAAADIAFGGPRRVTVQVQANFRRSSFDFDLIATAAVIVGQQLLQNISVSDLDTLLKWLGLTGRSAATSLFGILKKAGDRPIEEMRRDSTGNTTIVFAGDNANIVIGNVDPTVAKFVTDPTIRNAIPDVVGPVAGPGIDSYHAGSGPRSALVVTKDDLPRLQRPTFLKDELADDASETAIELLAPSFVDGNKWRVAQGGDAFWVRMLDEGFLASVERGERGFHKGDYLVVRLRTRAFATPDGLEVERDVLEVLDHKQRARQLPLL
jgi:hypothetical protein